VKRLLALFVAVLSAAACSTDQTAPSAVRSDALAMADSRVSVGSGQVVIVSHPYDAGKGSFRDAVEQANADPRIIRIEFKPNARMVRLQSSVVFTGTQALTIIGKNATLDATEAGGPAFIANGGGDLTIESLTAQNAPDHGIVVDVPSTATGTLRVVLTDVQAIGNAGHGIWIDDQTGVPVQDGVQPNADGSDASLDVILLRVHALNNGYSVSDRDGIRVDEGGLGSLFFTARSVRAENNAADGIELDERGVGDVVMDVSDTHILGNGSFDPEDLDDGFDVDEFNEGSIIGTLRNVVASHNFEEGLDFNENNAGDLRVDLFNVVANGNREEGIDYEEDDDFAGGGDLVAIMRGVTANGNGVDGGDAGLKIREKGAGELNVDIVGVEASNNLISGISIREDAVGNLIATVTDAQTIGNAVHGIDFDENRATSSDAGNLTAAVTNATSTGNGGVGVRADQQTPGTGVLTLTGVVLTGNTGGATTGNVSPTIVP
jgi:hypothetical protein